MSDSNARTQFKEGNQASLQHGGEGAVVRLRTGEPFINLALEVQKGVESALGVNLKDLSGIDRVLVERACRFEATARLFDAAAAGAAEAGDLGRWERYQQRSGWIGNRAFNALKELRDMLHLETGIITDYEEIASGER